MTNQDIADLAQRDFLKTGEVARLWQVDPKTVARWAKTNKVTYIWTPGGHRLYLPSDSEFIDALEGGEDE